MGKRSTLKVLICSIWLLVAITGFFSAEAWASNSLFSKAFSSPSACSAKFGDAFSSQPSGSDMLQFKAGGHVLGFQPTKVYLAGLDHALSLEFLDTPGVLPEAVGSAPSTGIKNTATSLTKVVYKNLWPGITLQYEAPRNGITESTYHIAPGADVANIRLRCNVPVELQKDGSLQFAFTEGYLTESQPVAWQDIAGKHVPVPVSFKISGEEIGFEVGNYDGRYPLAIDPTYAWHTFHGSSGADMGCSIAVDADSNIYVTGTSSAAWGSPLNAYNGGGDFFVLKLNKYGAYEWHTFFGSSYEDFACGLALDNSGNIYVSGYSEGTWGTPLHAYTGGTDIYVLKLNSSGAYQWHTFYGSNGDDEGLGVAVDASGNIYVTGEGNATWGTPLHTYTGGYDIYVLKLDSSGAYQWHTFYGSSGIDTGLDVAIDNSGYLYITGHSAGTWGLPLHGLSGGSDLFVLKLNSEGVLQWNTFYGGSDYDAGCRLALDSSANIYVGGTSRKTWGSPLHAHSGNEDILVLKLNSAGAYQWHTFYGTSNMDIAYDINLDWNGNIYATGISPANWGSPVHAFSGGTDISVLKLDNSGALQWNTFYGTSGNEFGTGIAVDHSGNVYVTGVASATWGLPLNAYAGDTDAFILKFNTDLPSCTYTLSSTAVSLSTSSTSGSVTVTPSSGICPWTAGSSDSWITVASGSSGTGTGSFSYSIAANTAASGRTGAITIAGQTFTVIQEGTAPSMDTVQKAYIGYYQRPADPAGQIWWADYLATHGGSLTAIIEAFANSNESRNLYGTIDSSNIATVINAIYQALFNRAADTAGREWYVAEFNKGTFTAATIMLNVLYGAQNDDLVTLNNKLIAANLFTKTIDPELDGSNFQATYAGDADAFAARAFLSLVTSAMSSIPSQSQITEYIKSYIADTRDAILKP